MPCFYYVPTEAGREAYQRSVAANANTAEKEIALFGILPCGYIGIGFLDTVMQEGLAEGDKSDSYIDAAIQRGWVREAAKEDLLIHVLRGGTL